MDKKTIEMLCLLQSEMMYLMSLLSGLYSAAFAEEHITPILKMYSDTYSMILNGDMDNYDGGLTS